MAKKKKKSRGRREPVSRPGNWRLWLLLPIGILIGAGLMVWASDNAAAPDDPPLPTAEGAAVYPIGPTTACQELPQFVAGVGLGEQILIDTTQQGYTGVALRNTAGDAYQHPSWDDAGNIGPHVIDRDGHIYVTPVAQVSLYVNPPAEQNKVYRIDSRTGEMSEYIALPEADQPSANNPFGAVGLAYDCDTDSLYVASVAGSTLREERGRIYRIDLTTGEMAARVDNVDALGLGAFNGREGKRLYYGSARSPRVYSLALDGDGNFAGDPRFEFSLAAIEGGDYDNAHRIRFTHENQMEVKGIEFGFRLLAASDPLRNVYTFAYQPESDSWQVVDVALQ